MKFEGRSPLHSREKVIASFCRRQWKIYFKISLEKKPVGGDFLRS
jgi:hypothetical protein